MLEELKPNLTILNVEVFADFKPLRIIMKPMLKKTLKKLFQKTLKNLFC